MMSLLDVAVALEDPFDEAALDGLSCFELLDQMAAVSDRSMHVFRVSHVLCRVRSWMHECFKLLDQTAAASPVVMHSRMLFC
jgi:hypothetical protein